MRKVLSFFSTLSLMILLVFGITSCNKEDGKKDDTYYTVSYVDATNNNEILKESQVLEGEKAERYTPEKEGYVFDDWYATPSLTRKFDFDSPITKDTTIFGYFTSDEFEKDSRDFYILGSSSDNNSILYNTQWKIKNDTQKLTKSENENVNEYTVTLDLYVGDSFQFAINDDFENQRGYGYLNGEPEKYFKENKNFLDPNSRKANISVLEAGNYTFTLTTHPWSDEYETTNPSYTEENKEVFNYNVTDTISFVRNGDPIVAPSTELLDIHIKGSYITGWNHDTSAEYTMTYNAETDTYEYSHEIIEGDSFMFYNFIKYVDENGEEHTTLGSVVINADSVDRENSDLDALILNPASNIMAAKRGTFSFSYKRQTNLVTIKYDPTFTSTYTPADTWYISGSGITEPLKSSAFGNNLTDAQKFTKVEGKDNTYEMTLDLAVGDLFQIVHDKNYSRSHSYQYIVEPEKDGKTYFSSGENIRVEVAGNYTLTLELSEESPMDDKITWVRNGDIVQELPISFDVFMKNSPDDGSENWEISDRYTTTDGVVEIRALFKAGTNFCFIYYNPGVPIEEVGSYNNPGTLITGSMKGTTGSYNDNFSINENDFVCNVEGFYVIQIDFNPGTPTVNFVEYNEKMPEFEAIIKGPAYDGTWNNSDKYQSQDGKVEMILDLTSGDNNNNEFMFAWFDDKAPSYGYAIAYSAMGTSGTANNLFTQQSGGGNNFVCTKSGTYKVVLQFVNGEIVVDFYNL